MKLTESTIANVVYKKASGEVTARTIIPTAVPRDVVQAIDVSEMAPDARIDLAQKHAEYRTYVKSHMERMFNFETWVEHTYGTSITPKWRSFTTSDLS